MKIMTMTKNVDEIDDNGDDKDNEKLTPTDSAANKEAKHQSKPPPINDTYEERKFLNIRDFHKKTSS